jgi:osmotically-inducible protein OsmY
MFNKEKRMWMFERLANGSLKRRVKTWMLTSMLIGGLARLRSRARFIPGLWPRRKQHMNPMYGLLAGAGAGAGLMYLLDPDHGEQRRASLADGASSAARKTGSTIGGASRGLAQRTRGLVAGTGSMFRSDDANDKLIVKRIRAGIDQLASYPRAINVVSHDGRASLTGHILAREQDNLIIYVRNLPGVVEVDNQLRTHERAEDIPNQRRSGDRQKGFSPTARTLMALAGGSLIGVGLRRRDALGVGLGTIGAGLMMSGVTNVGVKRLISR